MINGYRLMAKPGIVPMSKQPQVTPSVVNVPPRTIDVKPSIIADKQYYRPGSALVPSRPQAGQMPAVVQPPSRSSVDAHRIMAREPGKSTPRQMPAVVQPVLSARGNSQQAFRDEHVLRLHDVGSGRILVIVACGPSLKQIDPSPLKGHDMIDIMLINKPDNRLYPTRFWLFCDQSQYSRNQELFESYTGILINPESVRARHPKQILLKVKQGIGFAKDISSGFYIGRSSTYSAMQVAYYMNYDKVFFLGCDMAAAEDGSMWSYGVNPDVSPEVRASRFAKEAESFSVAARQLSQDERQKFVFCSSYLNWGFTQYFDKIDHKISIHHILAVADDIHRAMVQQ